jgi:DNA repair exonuclease SbcCD ATPase subunit
VSDREKLVKTFNGNPLSALSGGEFQKLSVACFLAYRQLLQNTTGWQSNLLILDEADVYLDQTACHSLFQMIKRVGGSTLVISHTNAMHRDMTLFEHHLELERDGNGSRKRKRV